MNARPVSKAVLVSVGIARMAVTTFVGFLRIIWLKSIQVLLPRVQKFSIYSYAWHEYSDAKSFPQNSSMLWGKYSVERNKTSLDYD